LQQNNTTVIKGKKTNAASTLLRTLSNGLTVSSDYSSVLICMQIVTTSFDYVGRNKCLAIKGKKHLLRTYAFYAFLVRLGYMRRVSCRRTT